MILANGDVIRRKCDWVAKDAEERCALSGIMNKCPVACGRCQAPSASPSVAPSQSPVKVLASISLQMGSSSGKPMDDSNQKLFQDTLNALLGQYDTTEQLNNLKTTISNQIVRKLTQRKLIAARELQTSNNYAVFFDLLVTGEVKAGTPDVDDAALLNAVESYFSNSTNSDTFLTALSDNSSLAAAYFRDVGDIAYTNTDPNSVGTPVDQNNATGFWNSNMAMILIASVSGCATILFIVAIFVIKRRRR